MNKVGIMTVFMMMDRNTPQKPFPEDLQNLPLQDVYNKRADL